VRHHFADNYNSKAEIDTVTMGLQFTLPDGRNVDYIISGAKDGFPLVWIHGTPSSCVPDPNIVAASGKKGVKVITLSRAGYGGSTRNKGRRIIDAVADIQHLLEHLEIKRFMVGGWSGGGRSIPISMELKHSDLSFHNLGPHALACGARLSGCVAVLSVASVAPYNAEGLDWLAGQGDDSKCLSKPLRLWFIASFSNQVRVQAGL
jgi:pimeloyl-ACP methyl ester carboxylesterase